MLPGSEITLDGFNYGFATGDLKVPLFSAIKYG